MRRLKLAKHPTTRLILETPPQTLLGDFIWRCKHSFDVDYATVLDLAVRTIRYLRSNTEGREQLKEARQLEKRWYDSLSNGEPLWAVYDTDYYLAELWACWAVYSRNYLRSLLLHKPQSLLDAFGSVRSVADLGCGIGYTTAALKQMFPDACVTGTNLPNILQTRIAKQIAGEFGCDIVADEKSIAGGADIVFASEYFEHIAAPLEHLASVLMHLRPTVLIVANAFGTRSIGHFNEYRVGRQSVAADKIGKRFAAALERAGYTKMKTNLWNDRPSIWRASDGG